MLFYVTEYVFPLTGNKGMSRAKQSKAKQSKAKQGTTFMDNPLIQQMSRCIFNST
jgi:hypothetical protein